MGKAKAGTKKAPKKATEKPEPKKVTTKAVKKKDAGKWEPICIIAMAQDVGENGVLLMSHGKVRLEQNSKTKEIRTVGL